MFVFEGKWYEGLQLKSRRFSHILTELVRKNVLSWTLLDRIPILLIADTCNSSPRDQRHDVRIPTLRKVGHNPEMPLVKRTPLPRRFDYHERSSPFHNRLATAP